MISYILPLLRQALRAIGVDAEEIPLGPPRDAANGDLATSLALVLARELREEPRSVAERIVAAMRFDPDFLAPPEVTGAGFINFHLHPRFFHDRLASMLALGERYGRAPERDETTTTIRYPAWRDIESLDIHHARAAALGDAIAAMLERRGANVRRLHDMDDAAGSPTRAATITLERDGEERIVRIHQMVAFIEGRRNVTLHAHEAASITLASLIEDLGAEVVRFFLVMRPAESSLEFDLDLARRHAENNPCYFLQYARHTITGVLRHLAQEEYIGSNDGDDIIDLSLLTHPAEISLIKSILQFPERLDRAAAELAPHQLIAYLRSLAIVHREFYHSCRIIAAPPETRNARKSLLQATEIVMRNGLEMLEGKRQSG